MKANSINHIAFDPTSAVAPIGRQREGNVDFALKVHFRVRLGRAQWDNRYQTFSLGYNGRNYDCKTSLNHFRWNKTLIKIDCYYRSAFWMKLKSQSYNIPGTT